MGISWFPTNVLSCRCCIWKYVWRYQSIPDATKISLILFSVVDNKINDCFTMVVPCFPVDRGWWAHGRLTEENMRELLFTKTNLISHKNMPTNRIGNTQPHIIRHITNHCKGILHHGYQLKTVRSEFSISILILFSNRVPWYHKWKPSPACCLISAILMFSRQENIVRKLRLSIRIIRKGASHRIEKPFAHCFSGLSWHRWFA